MLGGNDSALQVQIVSVGLLTRDAENGKSGGFVPFINLVCGYVAEDQIAVLATHPCGPFGELEIRPEGLYFGIARKEIAKRLFVFGFQLLGLGG